MASISSIKQTDRNLQFMESDDESDLILGKQNDAISFDADESLWNSNWGNLSSVLDSEINLSLSPSDYESPMSSLEPSFFNQLSNDEHLLLNSDCIFSEKPTVSEDKSLLTLYSGDVSFKTLQLPSNGINNNIKSQCRLQEPSRPSFTEPKLTAQPRNVVKKRQYRYSETSEDTGNQKKKKYEASPSNNPTEEKSRKNAILAKQNRDRKKELVQTLESQVKELSSENQKIYKDNSVLKKKSELQIKEIEYLRSIIANASPLANILKSLESVQGLKLSSSYKNFSNVSEESASASKVASGICIHVSGRQASLEFCAQCSAMSSE